MKSNNEGHAGHRQDTCSTKEGELMKQIIAIIVALLFFCPASGFSETKEIIAEGTYNMGDGETPTVAESRALLQAKRTAVEEAGTYVESYSKTRNFQLTVDEIQVLASGIMEVEVLEKKRTVVGDGFNFWIKIKARVSTDKMEEMAKRVKERSVVEDYKKIQAAYDKSQKEIEELKKQLAGAKDGTEKKKLEAKYPDKEKAFQTNEWLEKGLKHSLNQESDEAIDAFTNAISLTPNLLRAYLFRGIIYQEKRMYSESIEDYNKVIAIKPTSNEAYLAYCYRAGIFRISQDHDLAIKDLAKAISIKPKYAMAYLERGQTYRDKGQYDKAIKDFSTTIDIEKSQMTEPLPMKADRSTAYFVRGLAYFEKGGQYNRAIEDFSKSISINQKGELVYLMRGLSYKAISQYDGAIKDFSTYIGINPNDGGAYESRGDVYLLKNQDDIALYDYSMALKLDPNNERARFKLANMYTKRGAASLSKGDEYSAIEAFTKAIDIYPRAVSAYIQRGMTFSNKGRTSRDGAVISKAIEDYTKALALLEDDPMRKPLVAGIYAARADTFEMTGQYDRAIEDYSKSLDDQTHPNYTLNLVNRGAVYLSRGMTRAAMSDFQTACDLGYDLGCQYLQPPSKNR